MFGCSKNISYFIICFSINYGFARNTNVGEEFSRQQWIVLKWPRSSTLFPSIKYYGKLNFRNCPGTFPIRNGDRVEYKHIITNAIKYNTKVRFIRSECINCSFATVLQLWHRNRYNMLCHCWGVSVWSGENEDGSPATFARSDRVYRGSGIFRRTASPATYW